MTDIEKLLAIEEIKKLKARFFRHMDKKDYDGLLGLFTPDAIFDTRGASTPTNYKGEPVDYGVPKPLVDMSGYATDIVAFIDNMRVNAAPLCSVHQGHMPEIELTSPTTATGTWAVEDILRFPKGAPIKETHGYGHYEDSYERLPEGWRIKVTKLTRLRIDEY